MIHIHRWLELKIFRDQRSFPTCFHTSSPLPQPKDPLPRTACFGDKRWSSAVVILRGMEDQLIGRSWVLKFFPSQNSWRSSENPSENKTLPGIFWLRRASRFDIHTFPWAHSSLWVVSLDFSGGLRSQIHLLYKSNYFWKERNRDKGISHWKLAHRNSKISSKNEKHHQLSPTCQKKRSTL